MYGGEETYTTRLTLTVLDDDEWDLLWERTADRPAETEALLAGDLPEDLLEAVEDARVRMLPGYGDLDADCGCDTPTTPAATPPPSPTSCPGCWTPTPWLLLLIRGRDAEEAVEELKSALLLRALAGDEEEDEAYDAEAGNETVGGTAQEPDDSLQRAAYARPATPCPPCRRCPNRPPHPRSR